MNRITYWLRSWYETLKLHYVEPELEAELLRRAKAAKERRGLRM